MDADDRRALIKDIVDVIDARLIAPMERRLDVRFKALEKTDEALKESDAKRSGQHKLVTREILPRALSDSKAEREGENAGIATALNNFAGVVETLTAKVEAMESNMQPRAVVALPDGKGGRSIRPASLVAAESSVRTENKQDSLAKVILDSALDTTKAKDSSAAAQTWQKRVTTPLIIAVPVIVAVVREVWPLVFPHAPGP